MLKKSRLLTRPTLARQDAPYPKQGRRQIETGGGTDRTSWGRSPVQWILANGKHPPALPPYENLKSRYVEEFVEPRTMLADFWIILLEEAVLFEVVLVNDRGGFGRNLSPFLQQPFHVFPDQIRF